MIALCLNVAVREVSGFQVSNVLSVVFFSLLLFQYCFNHIQRFNYRKLQQYAKDDKNKTHSNRKASLIMFNRIRLEIKTDVIQSECSLEQCS